MAKIHIKKFLPDGSINPEFLKVTEKEVEQIVNRPATYLLVPYILWVSFASYLNYSIWMFN